MVAAVVLLVMLGTLIGAGLPLVNALVGVGISMFIALSLSGFLDVMTITPTLGLMLGLAVGIDYALFILHRHRTQLKAGMRVRDSIALANGTAGNAVVFAGATVVIALLALNVTGLPFLGLMGTVAAMFVTIAVMMAVSLTPAMLSLVGQRILSKKERAALQARGNQSSQKEKEHSPTPVPTSTITTPMPTAKAVAIAVVSVIGLGVLSIPTADLRLGMPDASAEETGSPAYEAFHSTAEHFGEGWNGPILAVADLPTELDDAAAETYQITIAEELGAHQDVDSVVPAAINDDNTTAIFQVIPVEGPSAESTEHLSEEFAAGTLLEGTDMDDVELSVAGATAANIEISEIISDALPLYLTLVVLLSLVLMVMVFRSILLPVIATLGFVGSFTAAIGVVVAIFQWGWLGGLFVPGDPGPVITFLPILMVGVLFGLGMDYQLFTATGMREAYAHGSPPQLAVRQGLHAGRAVVTAAALIMSSVFGAFAFQPDPMIAPLGLALAVGVLLDAFVVRILLVPAVLHLCGPAAWWLPKWLDKILPDVDVEGASLERAA